MGTRVQGSFSDHVVEACRGDEGTSYDFEPCRESVSWRTGVVEVCRGGGAPGTALGCRGYDDTRFIFGPFRGGVSWRMCRGHLRKVSWERDFISCYENENIYL